MTHCLGFLRSLSLEAAVEAVVCSFHSAGLLTQGLEGGAGLYYFEIQVPIVYFIL